MALDLQINLYLDSTKTNLYLEDTTGTYNASTNPGGYGTPNPTSASITDAKIRVSLGGSQVDFLFTISSNVITAATVGFVGSTAFNILADLSSTAWPFISGVNAININPAYYESTLLDIQDGAWNVRYWISSETYTTDENFLIDTETNCCVSKQLLAVNINNKQALVDNLVPLAFLTTAQYAIDAGLLTKAQEYQEKAAAICETQSGCGCGC